MVSLNDVSAGSSADSSCIQQVIDAWKGTAGKGVPLTVVAVNDSVNFAADFMNLDPANERTLRARDSSGTARLQVDVTGPQADPTGSGLAPIVNTNATQTLTNKTLNAPTINSAVLDQTSLVPVRLNSTVVTSTTQVNVDWSGISGNYSVLELDVYIRSEDGTLARTPLNMRFNNDSGANYESVENNSTGATNTAQNSTGATSMRIGLIPGSSAAAGVFGGVHIRIPGYASTSFKVALGQFVQPSALNNQTMGAGYDGGAWYSTQAVNRITLTPGSGNLSIGSRVVLYGLP